MLHYSANRWAKGAFLFVVFCLCIVTASLAVAASDINKKRTFGLRSGGEGHIQMRSLMAPAQRSASGKQVATIPVTVILSVKDNTKVGEICDSAPRINDSLMSAWHQNPIPYGYLYDRESNSGKTNVGYRRTKEQKAEDKRLIRIINHALGGNEIEQIIVLKGIMSMGSGAITRLPFSSVNGCDELEVTK